MEMGLSAGGVGCGVPEATDERLWLCGKGTAEFLPLVADGGGGVGCALKETLGCRARLGLSRARRRAKDTRPNAPGSPAFRHLPVTARPRQSPSGGAASAERPPVGPALG